jgi:hypothetical protein
MDNPDRPGSGMTSAETSSQLMAMASGAWVAQMIHVAAELGLADALAHGEQPLDRLAQGCGADPASLFRLLRGLASVGVFAETRPEHFSLTPLAELLRSDHPQSLRQFARLVGDEHYLSWAGLLDCVRSGESGFRKRYGTDVFSWYAQHPERAAVFNGAMGDLSRLEVTAFLDAYPDFAAIQHLVDVGGCRGELLEAVLSAHPHMRGTVFDQAAVLEGLMPSPQLGGRLALQAGDFFREMPAGADAYLMKHIVHDWHDEACLTILRQIRQAMAPGARLLILEPVIPAGNAPFPGKLLDLNMLVMTEGGRERTAAQYSQLLGAGGFRLERIVPTAGTVSVVEALAAG